MELLLYSLLIILSLQGTSHLNRPIQQPRTPRLPYLLSTLSPFPMFFYFIFFLSQVQAPLKMAMAYVQTEYSNSTYSLLNRIPPLRLLLSNQTPALLQKRSLLCLLEPLHNLLCLCNLDLLNKEKPLFSPQITVEHGSQ